MSTLDNIWVEKYRPQKLDDMILNTEVRTFIEGAKSKGEIPNLLLISTPGRGKTTLAKVIAKDVLECQYLYLNASDENGIDAIRERVQRFAETKTLFAKHKIVILDEADFITAAAQAALRNVMETYAEHCRFILTGNNLAKIVPAIQSRCIRLDVTPSLEDVVKLSAKILQQEGVEVTDKAAFVRFVKSRYPDVRRVIYALQKSCVGGKLVIDDDCHKNAAWLGELESISPDNLKDIRGFMQKHYKSYGGDFSQLLSLLFYWIPESNLQNKSTKLVRVAEYLYRHGQVMDPEINTCACLIEILK